MANDIHILTPLTASKSAFFKENIEVSGTISGSFIFGDGSGLTNVVDQSDISGAITGALTPYATLSGVSASFTTPAQVTGAISSFPTRTEVTGAISNFPTRTEVTGTLTNYANKNQQNIFTANQTISGNLNVTGTISGAFLVGDGSGLTNIAGVGGVSSTQVSGAITGALIPYATLSGVSASFTTPAQVTGALTAYWSGSQTAAQVTGAIANFPTRTEVTGVLGSYATLSGVSASFATPTQVTAAITNFPTRVEITGTLTNYAALGQQNSFTATQTISGNLNVTGTIRVATGSATTTSIGPVDDSNTGIWFPAADTINIGTNGNYGLQISSTRASYFGGSVSIPTNTLLNIGNNVSVYESPAGQANFSGNQVVTGNLSVTGTVSGTFFIGDGSGLTNIVGVGGVSSAQVSGAITGALIPYATLSGVSASFTTPAQVTGALTPYWSGSQTAVQITGALTPYWSGSQTAQQVTSAIANFPTRIEVTGALGSYATLSGVSASFTTPAQVTGAISNFPTRTEVTGALTPYWSGSQTAQQVTSAIASFPTRTEVTGVLTNYATLSGVSASFTTPAQVTSAITNFPTRAEVTGVLTPYWSGSQTAVQITGALTPYWSGSQTALQVTSAIANFPTRAEVSGVTSNFPTRTEVTGVLTSYATLSGVSASFTTPAQVTSALTPYWSGSQTAQQVTSAIANFPTRTEVTGVLINYATLSGVSASFTTPAQVTSAITNFPTRAEVTGALTPYWSGSQTAEQVTGALGSYVTLSGLSASYSSKAEVSGVLTSSAALLARQNVFTISQIISGNLNVTGTISGAFIVGDGSGLTNVVGGSGVSAAEVSGAITGATANFPTRTEVTGVLGSYATLSGLSASYAPRTEISGAITGAIANFPTRTEVSGVLTSSVALLARQNSFTTSQIISGNLNVTGAISGSTFTGNGAGLINLPVVVAGAVGFNADADGLKGVDAPTSDRSYTVCGWFKPVGSPTGTDNVIFGLDQGIGYGGAIKQISMNASNVINIYDNFGIKDAFTASLGTWYYMALVCDATPDLKLYWRSQTETSLSTTTKAATGTGDIMTGVAIGANTNFSTWVDGSITRVRLYDRILTSDECLAESYSLTPTSTSSLIGDYPLQSAETKLSASTGSPLQTIGAGTWTTDTGPTFNATASFTTRVDVSGAIVNFPTRAQVTGALGSYATLTGLSASYAPRTEISGVLSSSYTTLTGLSASYASKAEVSGVLTSSAALLARQNIFTISQIISGNLNVTGTISGAFIVGDGSGLTNVVGGSGVSEAEMSGAIANFPTRTEVSGVTATQFEMGVHNTSGVITTGAKGRKVVAYTGNILGWRMVADQTTNTVLDIWKANGTIPTVANSIAGTNKPTLTAATLASGSISTWTSASFAAGDVIVLNVDSNSAANYIYLELYIQRT